MKILFNGYKNLFDGSTKGVAGGPRVFTQQLVKYLQDNKHPFIGLVVNSKIDIGDVCEVSRYPASGGEWVETTLKLNLNLILNSKSGKIDKYFEPGVQRLSEIIAAEKPDVVLLNGFSIVNWYILKAASRAGIPIVVSHHGLWFKEAMEIISKSTKATLRLVKRMEKDIFNLSSHQVFLNEYSRGIFEQEYKVSTRKKSSIIPIPYNPLFLNKKLPRKNKSVVKKIGFVARWDAIKNPQIVYEIAKEAKRQKKKWEFNAVIKVNNAEKLKYLRNKFPKVVKVVPTMTPQKIKRFYQQMDLMLLPSRFDVSPTVVMEAALQNRATLISPTVGFVSEYKKTAMDYWIYDFKDIKKTVNKIEDALNKEISPKFIKYIAQNHQSSKILKQYLQLLNTVIRKEKA